LLKLRNRQSDDQRGATNDERRLEGNTSDTEIVGKEVMDNSIGTTGGIMKIQAVASVRDNSVGEIA
jgi:hypothetical protein